MTRTSRISSVLLIVAVLAVGGTLALWKQRANAADVAASQNQPEPSEAVTQAIAAQRDHRHSTTAIGTVLALRSISLRNEFPGTVKEVNLTPGTIVEPGQVLVALDVSVEEAELAALEASAVLAEANLKRKQALTSRGAEPIAEFERATAERDVALAQIERTKAAIARKTILAPFRARVGLSDVHPGQFLESGTLLTTLQGVGEGVHVDFDVAQHVASKIQPGDVVEISGQDPRESIPAKVVAVDSRVDASTRNARIRSLVEQSVSVLTPGSSVRVRIAHGDTSSAVAIPASALRRGPTGDHVFLIEKDQAGHTRVQSKKVQIGASLGDEVLIVAGLNAGDRVAASGSFKLRDAARVVVVDETTLALGAAR